MMKSNIVYYTGEKIELKNKNNSTAVIYNTTLHGLKVIRVDLKIKNLSLTQHISNLEAVNIYLQGIGFEVELKEPETVDEIIEEMKEKAKPFEANSNNYVVAKGIEDKKVSTFCYSIVENIGTLYFDFDTAVDFVERLQAAYNREGWK